VLGPIESEADFDLILGDEHFHISKWVFASYSEEFRSDRDVFESDNKRYDKNYRPEVFRLFVDACQDKPYLLLVTNCLELRRIADDFKAPSVLKLVDDFIAQHSDDPVFLLEKLAYEQAHHEEIADTINALAGRIDAVLDVPGFASLDLHVLTRIVGRSAKTLRNHHRFAEFCGELKRKGIQTAALVAILPFERLTADELRGLAADDIVPETMPGEASLGCLLALNDAISALEERACPLDGACNDFEEMTRGIGKKTSDRLNEAKHGLAARIDALRADVNGERAQIGGVARRAEILRGSAPQFSERFASELAQSHGRAAERVTRIANRLETVRRWLHPLDGIFSALTRRIGGNPLTNGMVTGLTPVPEDPEFPLANLLEFRPATLDLTYYHDVAATAPCDRNFFGFDFGENHSVVVDGYSIRTNGVGLDDLAIPTSFAILGSNDGSNWEVVHRVSGLTKFTRSAQILTFLMPRPGQPFRAIRYQQEDTKGAFSDRFGIIAISAFELFGEIQDL
jgi:hypothetical protein